MRRPLRTRIRRTSGPSLELVGNWTALNPSDRVVIYRGDTATASGSVDLRSPAGSVFWILQAGGQGRVMIHKADGVAVYRRTGHSAPPGILSSLR
ncbi:hypothetical protein GCM10009712_42800 [Pseudarthrobacter sulfonivorans]